MSVLSDVVNVHSIVSYVVSISSIITFAVSINGTVLLIETNKIPVIFNVCCLACYWGTGSVLLFRKQASKM